MGGADGDKQIAVVGRIKMEAGGTVVPREQVCSREQVHSMVQARRV